MLDKISFIALIQVIIGAGIFLASYLYYSFLLIASEKTIRKTRTAYIQAILRQETAWFDVNNPAELSARIGKETLAI